MIPGYGFSDIWTKEHKHTGEIKSTLSVDGITLRSGGVNYFSPKVAFQKMLSGERKTVPRVRKEVQASGKKL